MQHGHKDQILGSLPPHVQPGGRPKAADQNALIDAVGSRIIREDDFEYEDDGVASPYHFQMQKSAAQEIIVYGGRCNSYDSDNATTVELTTDGGTEGFKRSGLS